MKFMFYTYECPHGDRDVDCEFVMAADVGSGPGVL